MKNKILFPALCAAVLSFSAGCINDFNEDDHVALQEGLMESVMVSDNLAGDIRIIQTSRLKTESGVEVVCVRGRLKRDGFASFVFDSVQSIDLSYRFIWYDAEGKVIEGSCSGWNTLVLHPGEEFSCTSYSPMKNAGKVQLEIKKGMESAVPAADCAKKDAADELPADIREGKATTTKEIKAKTDEVEKKNKTIQKVNEKVNQKNADNKCLCGCASGETCYCPEGSACPNTGKNKKK